MRRALTTVITLCLLGGCYLSHEAGAEAPPDRPDVRPPTASIAMFLFDPESRSPIGWLGHEDPIAPVDEDGADAVFVDAVGDDWQTIGVEPPRGVTPLAHLTLASRGDPLAFSVVDARTGRLLLLTYADFLAPRGERRAIPADADWEPIERAAAGVPIAPTSRWDVFDEEWADEFSAVALRTEPAHRIAERGPVQVITFSGFGPDSAYVVLLHELDE
ncbi:MAG: hypothetical protein AB7S26_34835 [Sandaracinaceae bacterium]